MVKKFIKGSKTKTNHIADFLTLKPLEGKITDIIFHAKKSLLFLLCPAGGVFQNTLLQSPENPDVHIIVVFGKNEDDKGKSLRKEDFEFFKQFPTFSILYLKDLHAKYYAN